MIWGARNIPQPALLKLMILYTWDGCLSESLEVPKGSQATCSVWCGSRSGYGANAMEICLISNWFWVHRVILISLGYISVLLVLWQCCWGFSGVQSSKSRLQNESNKTLSLLKISSWEIDYLGFINYSPHIPTLRHSTVLLMCGHLFLF